MPSLRAADIELLNQVKNGVRTLPSNHLIRLELMGLVIDRPGGPLLTRAGQRVLLAPLVEPPADKPEVPDTVASPGRRPKFSRRSPF